MGANQPTNKDATIINRGVTTQTFQQIVRVAKQFKEKSAEEVAA